MKTTSTKIDGFRLSPQQRNTWSHLRADASSRYWGVSDVLIEGDLDERLLCHSISKVIEQHEVLRTNFVKLPEMAQPLQVIAETGALQFSRLDPVEGTQENGTSCGERMLDSMGKSGLDWSRDPLLHTALTPFGKDKHVLSVALPAMCGDMLSLSNLTGEIIKAYAEASEAAEIDEPPLQYADIAEVFNELIESEEAEAGRQYWQSKTLDQSRALLPFETGKGDTDSFSPGTYRTRIEAKVMESVEAYSASVGSKASEFMLACWQIMIARLTDESEVEVGLVASGRTYDGMENTLGLFAKHLPMKARIDGESPFSKHLESVVAEAREAEEWQDFFTWELFDESGEDATSERFTPYTFEYSEIHSEFSSESSRFKVVEQWMHVERFKIKLSCIASEKNIRLYFHYDQTLFEPKAIERLARNYVSLVEHATREPESKTERLTIVSPQERDNLLVAFSGDSATYRADRCLQDLFQEQVARTPEEPAVIAGEVSLSYREVDERSNQLARFLIVNGVSEESRVGLCAERSIELVIGILGILKAGGAYVPIDPSYPSARLSFMVDDAGLEVILAQPGVLDKEASKGVHLINLDLRQSSIINESGKPLPVRAMSRNLAYVIYTSGSTGRPKGVAVSHGAICNRLLWMQRDFPLTECDRVLFKTPFSFDASVWEIFSPLIAGGQVVVAAPEGHRDPRYLIEEIKRSKVTRLQVVPSLLRLLIAEEAFASCSSLRRVFSGGEALPRDLADQFARTLDAPLHNLYGPTEAAIDTCTWQYESDPKGSKVPIGRPIANMKVLSLDRCGEPVPIDSRGELNVGGMGLARGYLERPALTAEKFVPDSFSRIPGERLYRTGDLARFRESGILEFEGRFDRQVKLRGFRIETGEVEAAIRKVPRVRDARVIQHARGSDRESLVAYVVPDSGSVAESELYELPNGLQVAHLNPTETELIYKEVFEDAAYSQHGVTVRNGDCIFDVGANIGLFSLWAKQSAENVEVYAFEPIPPTFEKLKANVEIYGLDVHACNFALSDRAGEEEFTFYPKWSGMSGMYSDLEEERELTRIALNNQVEQLSGAIEGILERRFESTSFRCELKALSDVIESNAVEKIHLLKIDVEKSELDVLNGITREDWEKIDQIVIEAHSRGGRVSTIEKTLKEHGFEVVIDQDPSFAGSDLFNIYAVHPRRREGSVMESAAIPSVLHRSREAVSVETVRSALSETLPSYMVPGRFVVLNDFPLLPNGKVDLGALPDPEEARTGGAHEGNGHEPRNQIEDLLLAIFREVLDSEDIGVNDNFFDLGGHSILAAEMNARLQEVFGVDLPLRSLFEAPTVAGLGEKIEISRRESRYLVLPPIEKVARDRPLPLSYAQERMWIHDQLEEGSGAYRIPMAIRFQGSLDLDVLSQSWITIVQRHESLRTVFVEGDDGPIQIITPARSQGNLPLIDLSGAPAASARLEMERMISGLTRLPLHLSEGPLWHVYILRVAPDDHVVCFVIHHIVTDGWSTGVLIRELAESYSALVEGTEISLVDLPVQYADYSVWQRGWLRGDVLESLLAYWRRLEGVSPVLELINARPKEEIGPPISARHIVHFSPSLTKRLAEMSRREDVTLFMVVLAAFKVVLHRYSGRTDLLVGTPNANRGRVEVEGLIGLFANFLILYTDLSSNPTFNEVLKRVRETALQAYDHQELPFEKLVKEIRPDRSQSATPLVQVAIAFLSEPLPSPDLPGLTLTSLPVATQTPKFDLVLEVMETRNGSLQLIFCYNSGKFESTAISGMADQFQVCLERVIENPMIQLNEIVDFMEGSDQELKTRTKVAFKDAKRKRLREVTPKVVTNQSYVA